MKPKVLVTYPIAQQAIEKLREFAEVKLNPNPQPLAKEQLRKEVEDADGVILSIEKFDKELIAAAPRLRIIARYGVGYDNIDVKAATGRKIFVAYTPDVLSDAVADLTFAFILALSRAIIEADRYVKSGEWSKGIAFPLGLDLARKTLGIVGLGRIGVKVIERAAAFNMSIVYYDVIRNRDAEEKYGASPFIIPAMGSHGGATPEGQVGVLRSLGITEEVVKAPIVSSLEVEEIGRLHNNYPVYVSRNALNSDGIVLVNRVKPHTDFKDEIESGLMKMAVIGLGKQKGAETLHSYGMEGYHKYLPMVAKYIMKKLPILFGLAIVENAYHEISIIKAIPAEKTEEEERELLEKAKRLMSKIPFKDIDLLIVDQIGKDISGAGMDPNVTGRFTIPPERPPNSPNIKMIVALDLNENTEGNAAGIGFADLSTRRLFSKIDFEKTFVNSLTAGYLGILGTKIPIFLPSDKDAIETALRVICPPIDPKKSKIVRIRNTLDVEHMWISESLIEEVKANKKLNETIRIVGKTKDIMFDVMGNLVR